MLNYDSILEWLEWEIRLKRLKIKEQEKLLNQYQQSVNRDVKEGDKL